MCQVYVLVQDIVVCEFLFVMGKNGELGFWGVWKVIVSLVVFECCCEVWRCDCVNEEWNVFGQF